LLSARSAFSLEPPRRYGGDLRVRAALTLRRNSVSRGSPNWGGFGCRGCAGDEADRISSGLETAGVEFIDENGGDPGVRLRKRQQK